MCITHRGTLYVAKYVVTWDEVAGLTEGDGVLGSRGNWELSVGQQEEARPCPSFVCLEDTLNGGLAWLRLAEALQLFCSPRPGAHWVATGSAGEQQGEALLSLTCQKVPSWFQKERAM